MKMTNGTPEMERKEEKDVKGTNFVIGKEIKEKIPMEDLLIEVILRQIQPQPLILVLIVRISVMVSKKLNRNF